MPLSRDKATRQDHLCLGEVTPPGWGSRSDLHQPLPGLRDPLLFRPYAVAQHKIDPEGPIDFGPSLYLPS